MMLDIAMMYDNEHMIDQAGPSGGAYYHNGHPMAAAAAAHHPFPPMPPNKIYASSPMGHLQSPSASFGSSPYHQPFGAAIVGPGPNMVPIPPYHVGGGTPGGGSSVGGAFINSPPMMHQQQRMVAQQQLQLVEQQQTAVGGGAGPSGVLLSQVLEVVVQKVYHELLVLCELLPKKSDVERKISVVQLAHFARQLFIRLLAVTRWAKSSDKVEKCQAISALLQQQAAVFVDTADRLVFMSRGSLLDARLPAFQIPAAVDVLTLGTYPRLPVCIKSRFVPDDPISEREQAAVLSRITHVIKQRLVSNGADSLGHLPRQMRWNAQVRRGMAVFIVAGEFKVALTMLGELSETPWAVLDVRILVKDVCDAATQGNSGGSGSVGGNGADLVHPLQLHYLHQLAQGRMNQSERPLHELYAVLHQFCISLQLEVLYWQAQKLLHQRLSNMMALAAATAALGRTTPSMAVREYLAKKRLTLDYWKSDGTAVGEGCRLTIEVDPIDSARPLSTSHYPPFEDGDEEAALMLPPPPSLRADWLNLEELLCETVLARIRLKLRRLIEYLRSAASVVATSIELIDSSSRDNAAPCLKLSVLEDSLPSEQLCISVNSNSGKFLLQLPALSTTAAVAATAASPTTTHRKLLSDFENALNLKFGGGSTSTDGGGRQLHQSISSSSLSALLSQIRLQLIVERCRRCVVGMLQVRVSSTLPLTASSTALLTSMSTARLFVRFNRYNNFFLLLEFITTDNNDKNAAGAAGGGVRGGQQQLLRIKYHLLSTHVSSAPGMLLAVGGNLLTSFEKAAACEYLQPINLVELDSDALKSVYLSTISTTSSHLSMSADSSSPLLISSRHPPPSKRRKMDTVGLHDIPPHANTNLQTSTGGGSGRRSCYGNNQRWSWLLARGNYEQLRIELFRSITFCEHRLPFLLIGDELSTRCQMEVQHSGTCLHLLELSPTLLSDEVVRRFWQQRVRSCTIRLVLPMFIVQYQVRQVLLLGNNSDSSRRRRRQVNEDDNNDDVIKTRRRVNNKKLLKAQDAVDYPDDEQPEDTERGAPPDTDIKRGIKKGRRRQRNMKVRGLMKSVVQNLSCAQDNIQKSADELINGIVLFARLHDCVERFAPYYHRLRRQQRRIMTSSSVIPPEIEVKTYSYFKLVLAYGPRLAYTVMVHWVVRDNSFHLVFGTQGAYFNPHLLQSAQFKQEFNQRPDLVWLCEMLRATIEPLLSVARLNPSPYLYPQASGIKEQVAQPKDVETVPALRVISLSLDQLRIVYRGGVFVLEVLLLSGGMVVLRDASFECQLPAFRNLLLKLSTAELMSMSTQPSSMISGSMSAGVGGISGGAITMSTDVPHQQLSAPNSILMQQPSSVSLRTPLSHCGAGGGTPSKPMTPASPAQTTGTGRSNSVTGVGSVIGFNPGSVPAPSPQHGFSLTSPMAPSPLASSSQGAGGGAAGPSSIIAPSPVQHPGMTPSPAQPLSMATPSPANPLSHPGFQLQSSPAAGPLSVTAVPSPLPSVQQQHSQQLPSVLAQLHSVGDGTTTAATAVARAPSTAAVDSMLADFQPSSMWSESPRSMGGPASANPQTPQQQQQLQSIGAIKRDLGEDWAPDNRPIEISAAVLERLCACSSGCAASVGGCLDVDMSTSGVGRPSVLEHYLGCVYVLSRVERWVQHNDNLADRQFTSGRIQFTLGHFRFQLSLDASSLCQLKVNINVAAQYEQAWSDWSNTDNFSVLERYFLVHVVGQCYRDKAVEAFLLLLYRTARPDKSDVLRAFLQVMRLQLSTDPAALTGYRWRGELCWITPPMHLFVLQPSMQLQMGQAGIQFNSQVTRMLFWLLLRPIRSMNAYPRDVYLPLMYDLPPPQVLNCLINYDQQQQGHSVREILEQVNQSIRHSANAECPIWYAVRKFMGDLIL